MKSAHLLAVVASLMASADAFPFQAKEQEPKHYNPRLARRQWFFGSNTSSVLSEPSSISETELYTQQAGASASSEDTLVPPASSPEVATPSVVTHSELVSEIVSSFTSVETTVLVIPSVASSSTPVVPVVPVAPSSVAPVAPLASSAAPVVPESSAEPIQPVPVPQSSSEFTSEASSTELTSESSSEASSVDASSTTQLTSRQFTSSRFDGLFSSWFDDVTSGQSWLTSYNSSQTATPRPTTPGVGVPSSHGASETSHDSTHRGSSRESSSSVVVASSSSTVAVPAPASSPAGTFSSASSKPSSAVAASSSETETGATTTVVVSSESVSVGSTVTVGESSETTPPVVTSSTETTSDTKTLITETTPIGEPATTSSTSVVVPVPVSSAGPVISSGGGVLSSVLPYTEETETATSHTETGTATETGTSATETATSATETATSATETATETATTETATGTSATDTATVETSTETTSSAASQPSVIVPPVSHQSGMSQFTSVLPFTDTETSTEETASSSTEVVVAPTSTLETSTETTPVVEPTATTESATSSVAIPLSSGGAGFTSVIGWSDTETTEVPTATSVVETSSSELTSEAVTSTAAVETPLTSEPPTISSGLVSGLSSVAPWSPSETETATESTSEILPVIPSSTLETTTASPTEEAASASALPSHLSSDLGFSSVSPYIPASTETTESAAPTTTEAINSAATTVDLLSTSEAAAAVSSPVSSGSAFSSVSPYIPEATTESLAVVSQESSLEVVSQVATTTSPEQAAGASSTAAGMLPVSSYSADEPFTSVLGSSVDASSRVSEITAVVQSSTAGEAAAGTSVPVDASSSEAAAAGTVSGTVSPAVTSATEAAPTAQGTSESSNWFPAAIVTQSASSTLEAGAEYTSGDVIATATATASASGIPSSLPKIIAPSDGFPDSPKDSTLIQIGFTYALNYPFIVNNPVSVAQIFHYLPEGVGFGLGVNAENVSMRNIQPYDSASAGYIVSLALAYIPSDQVSTLTALLHTPTSKLYRNPDSSIQTLMNLIDPSIPLIPGSETISSPGNGLEGVNGAANGGKNGQAGSAGNNGDGSDKNNGNKKADAGGNQGGTNPWGSIDNSGATSSTPVDRKTVGIAVGAIVGAFAYGGAIFLVSKRYRKKKTMALDSSDSGSSVRSRYFDDTESSNFDAASVPSHSHTHSPANNPRSFVPRAQISQPVMSENSLGWT